MLDYTQQTQRREGVVVLSLNASRYVPKRSGLYQIIPTPYTYSETGRDASFKNYFQARKVNVLDLKRPLAAEMQATYRKVRIEVEQASSGLFLNSPDEPTREMMRMICTFFPTIYIGQANELKDRFIEHAQGRNSNVRVALGELGMSENLVFFRWIEVPTPMLNELERVLIRAHLPDLNLQGR